MQQLKRQHSFEPLNRPSPGSIGSTSVGATPPADSDPNANSTLSSSIFGGLPDDSDIGSPLKRHRASLNGPENESMQKRLGMGFASGRDIMAAAEAAHSPLPEPAIKTTELEEEL